MVAVENESEERAGHIRQIRKLAARIDAPNFHVAQIPGLRAHMLELIRLDNITVEEILPDPKKREADYNKLRRILPLLPPLGWITKRVVEKEKARPEERPQSPPEPPARPKVTLPNINTADEAMRYVKWYLWRSICEEDFSVNLLHQLRLCERVAAIMESYDIVPEQIFAALGNHLYGPEPDRAPRPAPPSPPSPAPPPPYLRRLRETAVSRGGSIIRAVPRFYPSRRVAAVGLIGTGLAFAPVNWSALPHRIGAHLPFFSFPQFHHPSPPHALEFMDPAEPPQSLHAPPGHRRHRKTHRKEYAI